VSCVPGEFAGCTYDWNLNQGPGIQCTVTGSCCNPDGSCSGTFGNFGATCVTTCN
jgi:hypothetical protein